MRSVRDVAVVYQCAARRSAGSADVSLVGLGFGGWIAAEMATMAPRAFRRLVLVGAMGIKPERGRDPRPGARSATSTTCGAGFADQSAFDRIYGAEPPTRQLEQWDLNREMTFRIAWKPYMYNPTLPHLLGGVTDARRWSCGGARTAIVPLECGERYARALPRRRLESSRAPATSSRWSSPRRSRSARDRFAAQA